MSERDKTQYLRLIKPEYEEAADIDDLNDDLDILDRAAGLAVHNITRSGTTFTVTRADGTTFTFDQQDTTYSQISRGSGAGLCPGLPSGSGTTKYLREDGTWNAIPTYSQISRGSGAGLCPGLPSGSGTTKFLREDGTWNAISNASTASSGLMSADDKTKLNGITANADHVTLEDKNFNYPALGPGDTGEVGFSTAEVGKTPVALVRYETDDADLVVISQRHDSMYKIFYIKVKNVGSTNIPWPSISGKFMWIN